MPKAKNQSYSQNMEREIRRRKLRKTKKTTRRNREDRAPRCRDWTDTVDEGEDTAAFERIMPRDEADRRKAVEEVMKDIDIDGEPKTPELITEGAQGRVIEVSAGMCRVTAGDRIVLCEWRGSLTAQETGYTNVVVVGDEVIFTGDGHDRGMIEQILPRRNEIARPDPFYTHLRQPLAANVDQLLIVASWQRPHFWPELVDRYLIAGERSGIEPTLCVNKIDLADDTAELEATLAPYRALDLSVLLTSAVVGDGLDALHGALRGRVTVLVGLSGVGKSTLLNAIQPGFDLLTGGLREDYGQGRHTTSQAIMLPLGNHLSEDGYVIDTPGIREFGLVGLTRRDLIHFYPEMAALAGACRFSDCSHLREPDCAVRAEVESGVISATRYESYCKIRETLPEQ